MRAACGGVRSTPPASAAPWPPHCSQSGRAPGGLGVQASETGQMWTRIVTNKRKHDNCGSMQQKCCQLASHSAPPTQAQHTAKHGVAPPARRPRPHRLQDGIEVLGQRGLEVRWVQRAALVVGSQLLKGRVGPAGGGGDGVHGGGAASRRATPRKRAARAATPGPASASGQALTRAVSSGMQRNSTKPRAMLMTR